MVMTEMVSDDDEDDGAFAIHFKPCVCHAFAMELSCILTRICQAFAKAKKPAGYACIAPALAASVYDTGVKLTIGSDEATANGINAMGATHVNCAVDEVVVDNEAKLVTTPAYMLAQSISEAHEGISKMVETVLAMK